MNLTLKELSARQNAPPNPSKTQRNLALKDFCDNANAQLKKLKADANNAKTVYVDCLEHFGEDAKNMDANTFFAILVRFCAGWKTAESENIKREKLKKAQELQKALQENNNQDNLNNQVNNKNRMNMKNTQASLIAELKNKNTIFLYRVICSKNVIRLWDARKIPKCRYKYNIIHSPQIQLNNR